MSEEASNQTVSEVLENADTKVPIRRSERNKSRQQPKDNTTKERYVAISKSMNKARLLCENVVVAANHFNKSLLPGDLQGGQDQRTLKEDLERSIAAFFGEREFYQVELTCESYYRGPFYPILAFQTLFDMGADFNFVPSLAMFETKFKKNLEVSHFAFRSAGRGYISDT